MDVTIKDFLGTIIVIDIVTVIFSWIHFHNILNVLNKSNIA